MLGQFFSSFLNKSRYGSEAFKRLLRSQIWIFFSTIPKIFIYLFIFCGVGVVILRILLKFYFHHDEICKEMKRQRHQKGAILEQSIAEWRLGLGANVFKVCMVPFTVKCSSSIWGHSVYFRFLANLVSRKRLVVEHSGRKFGRWG